MTTKCDYHASMCTSRAGLAAALEQYHAHKAAMEAELERHEKTAQRAEAARNKVVEATREVEKRKAELVELVNTDLEAKGILELQKARKSLQEARDVLEAVGSRGSDNGRVDAEHRAMEEAKTLAISAMVAEELEELPEKSLNVLRRAFSVYNGSMRWEMFLDFVLPRLDVREQPALRAEVIQKYGLED